MSHLLSRFNFSHISFHFVKKKVCLHFQCFLEHKRSNGVGFQSRPYNPNCSVVTSDGNFPKQTTRYHAVQ